MRKPEFITFTGIDDATDLIAASALAREFPVEYGILFSPERQGQNRRYPGWGSVDNILMLAAPRSRYSAHLCGGHSRQLLATASTTMDSWIRDHFARVQINTAYAGIDTAAIAEWAETVQAQPILQCRGAFPDEEDVSWLFDSSGGRGVVPASWPTAPPLVHDPAIPAPPRLVGYAGGISPKNITEVLPAIAAAAGDNPYWIDMESGVRDEQDRFDLAKCRAVCEAVYGAKVIGDRP